MVCALPCFPISRRSSHVERIGLPNPMDTSHRPPVTPGSCSGSIDCRLEGQVLIASEAPCSRCSLNSLCGIVCLPNQLFRYAYRPTIKTTEIGADHEPLPCWENGCATLVRQSLSTTSEPISTNLHGSPLSLTDGKKSIQRSGVSSAGEPRESGAPEVIPEALEGQEI